MTSAPEKGAHQKWLLMDALFTERFSYLLKQLNHLVSHDEFRVCCLAALPSLPGTKFMSLNRHCGVGIISKPRH